MGGMRVRFMSFRFVLPGILLATLPGAPGIGAAEIVSRQLKPVTVRYRSEAQSETAGGMREEFRTGEVGLASDGSIYENQEGSVSYAYDAATRRLQTFDVRSGLVSTVTVGPVEALARAGAVIPRGDACPPPPQFMPAGTDTLLAGIPVVQYARKDERSAVNVWLAPSYNCMFLKDELVRMRGGRVVERRVRQAVSVTPGEPDRRLFHAPAGLREVPPSEIEYARFRDRAGPSDPVPEPLRRTGEMLDKPYQAPPQP
jgi:hypothetical protein